MVKHSEDIKLQKRLIQLCDSGILDTRSIKINDIKSGLSSENDDTQMMTLFILDSYCGIEFDESLKEPRIYHEKYLEMKGFLDEVFSSQNNILQESLKLFIGQSRSTGICDKLKSDLSKKILSNYSSSQTRNIRSVVSTQSKPQRTKQNERIVVVHGTWAKGDWWVPGKSKLIDYIDRNHSEAYVNSTGFRWTGLNGHRFRLSGAKSLYVYLKNHKWVDTIISHSHGGNLALAVTKLVKREDFLNIILLGTPMRIEYTPDLRKVKNLYNIYSPSDLTQLVGTLSTTGLYNSKRGDGRTISDSNKVKNIYCEKINNKWPGHSDLHEDNVWQDYDWLKLL